jgi:DNA-directed RNA polymerase subunit M/transcription elongation factor TFIIS
MLSHPCENCGGQMIPLYVSCKGEVFSCSTCGHEETWAEPDCEEEFALTSFVR